MRAFAIKCNHLSIFATHFIRSDPPYRRKVAVRPLSPFLPRKDWPPARAGGFFVVPRHDTTTSIAIQQWLQPPRKEGRNMPNKMQNESDMVRVFCRYIVRNGKVIYPKNGQCFSFLVKA